MGITSRHHVGFLPTFYERDVGFIGVHDSVTLNSRPDFQARLASATDHTVLGRIPTFCIFTFRNQIGIEHENRFIFL